MSKKKKKKSEANKRTSRGGKGKEKEKGKGGVIIFPGPIINTTPASHTHLPRVSGRPGNEDAPRVIEALTRAGVVSVAAGGWHSAAVTAGGACYIWGRGEYGRLGMGADCTDKPRPVELQISQRIVQAALGGTHTCLLDEAGTVLSFGRNSLGRLGRVADGKWTGAAGQVVFPPPPGGGRWRCTSVVAGGRHNMATAAPVSRAEEEAERLAGRGGHQPQLQPGRGGEGISRSSSLTF